METTFESIIHSFIENKVGIAENFLSESLAKNLKENLATLLKNNQLLAAGTGNGPIVSQNKLIRSDIIYWLDRKHCNVHENSFLDLMDEFIKYLNETCYTGITGCEFHYTLYSQGSFYSKHIDQFKNNSSRQYSLIMYLNENWIEADGGELCIHHSNWAQKIAPTNGKSVFFQSNQLAHEVLVTHKDRLSITGWLKK